MSKILLQDLVGSLHLTICLRMVGGRETGADAQNLESFSHKARDKSHMVLRDHVLWEAMEADNLVHTELGRFLGEG